MSNRLNEAYRVTGELMQRLANLAEGLELCLDNLPSGRYDDESGQQILRKVSEAHGLIEAIRGTHLPNIEHGAPKVALVLKYSLQNLESKVLTISALLNKLKSLSLVRPKVLPKYVPPALRMPEEEALA